MVANIVKIIITPYPESIIVTHYFFLSAKLCPFSDHVVGSRSSPSAVDPQWYFAPRRAASVRPRPMQSIYSYLGCIDGFK